MYIMMIAPVAKKGGLVIVAGTAGRTA